MTELITELCPSCECEASFYWDIRWGYHAHCPSCGGKLMLCDRCPATHDKEYCDYDSELDCCHRQSMTWAEYKARINEEKE